MMLIYCEVLGQHFIFPDFTNHEEFIEFDVNDLEFVFHYETNAYDNEESALRFGLFLIHFYEMVDWF